MTPDIPTAYPPVVSASAWQAARDRLLAKEKAMTRALDALAAERRQLPMVRIEKDCRFVGPHGTARLRDMFEGRRRLLLYHFNRWRRQDEYGQAG